MISALNFGLTSLGWSPDHGHCVVEDSLLSDSVSLLHIDQSENAGTM